jgi:hypothetical protein
MQVSSISKDHGFFRMNVQQSWQVDAGHDAAIFGNNLGWLRHWTPG